MSGICSWVRNLGSSREQENQTLLEIEEEGADSIEASRLKAIPYAAAAAASVAGRVFNLNSWANGLFSLAVGASGILSIQKLLPERVEPIGRTASSLFGQVGIFFLSQAYANTENPFWQEFCTASIVGCLGAQLVLVAQRLIDDYGVKLETNESDEIRLKFPPPVIGGKTRTILRLAIPLSLGAGVFFTEDMVLKMMLAFSSTYWIGHGSGSIGAKLINRKIERDDQAFEGASSWRVVKTILNTGACLGIPLMFIPFNEDPHSKARQSQLPFIGGLAGLLQGFVEQSVRERWERTPIEYLPELYEGEAPLDSVELLQRVVSRTEVPNEERGREQFSLPYRIYEASIGPLVVSGLIAFCLWQDLYSLKGDRVDQAALATMTGAALASMGAARLADQWNIETRKTLENDLTTRVKDRAIQFFMNPTFLGMNLSYLVFAGFNALPMNDVALEEETKSYQIWNTVLWGLYGASSLLEHQQMRSRKKGVLPRVPSMALVNGILTFYRIVKGQIR